MHYVFNVLNQKELINALPLKRTCPKLITHHEHTSKIFKIKTTHLPTFYN